jgi:hypothetical protein
MFWKMGKRGRKFNGNSMKKLNNILQQLIYSPLDAHTHFHLLMYGLKFALNTLSSKKSTEKTQRS